MAILFRKHERLSNLAQNSVCTLQIYTPHFYVI